MNTPPRPDQQIDPPATVLAPGGAAGIFRGRLVVIFGQAGSGLFVYSGPPGTGNLIVSAAGTAGTDPYGNAYPEGLQVSQGVLNVTTTQTGELVVNPGPLLLIGQSATVVTTFTTAGAFTFTPPAGVTSLKVECVAGGAWATISTTGAGGGEYAAEPAVAVTPLTVYNGSVGRAGTSAPQTPGNSTFTGDVATVTANAPLGNVRTGGTGSTNSVHFNGGNGGIESGSGTGGGGGGGSGGSLSAGNNGQSVPSGTAGGAGGAAVTGGGAGGNGGNNSQPGKVGGAPGGGSGGSGVAGGSPANGAVGQVTITYTSGVPSLIASMAQSAGTDMVSGLAYPAGLFGQLLTALATAVQPGTTETAETWHTLSLAGGWTTIAGQPVPSYRLLPDGNIQIVGAVTHAAFSTPTNLSTVGALPAAYQPTTTQFVPGSIAATDAGIDITTAGTVIAQPGGVSLTFCRFGGTYPVNL